MGQMQNAARGGCIGLHKLNCHAGWEKKPGRCVIPNCAALTDSRMGGEGGRTGAGEEAPLSLLFSSDRPAGPGVGAERLGGRSAGSGPVATGSGAAAAGAEAAR